MTGVYAYRYCTEKAQPLGRHFLLTSERCEGGGGLPGSRDHSIPKREEDVLEPWRIATRKEDAVRRETPGWCRNPRTPSCATAARPPMGCGNPPNGWRTNCAVPLRATTQAPCSCARCQLTSRATWLAPHWMSSPLFLDELRGQKLPEQLV